MVTRDIVIIGGGVVGLCVAYYCAKRGHHVRVIDRAARARDGCSFGNAGMVVPSHFIPLASPGMVGLGLKWMLNPESPFYIPPRLDPELLGWGWKFWRACTQEHVKRSAPILRDLGLAGRRAFDELSTEDGLDFGFEKRGLLMLCKSQQALEHEATASQMATQLGIEAIVLDSRQTALKEPAIPMDIAGSIYFPQDCHMDPARFMGAMQTRLESLQVEFQWDTEIAGWRLEDDRVLGAITNRGAIKADEFVICGGSWSSGLAHELGLNLPMQPGKGYSLTLENPRHLPSICAILHEARIAMTPMGGCLRFAGTMELAGFDPAVNPPRIRGITNAIPRYFPTIRKEDFDDVKPWKGFRPCSPDGLPYLGRTRRYSNLSIATGHAMLGLSLGPISGQILAETLSGEPPSIAIRALSPDRYDGA